jgi:uncharacterized cupin superfamily protein
MRFWILLLWLCTAGATQAEVYRWVDANGQVHYSDRKLREDAEDVTKQTRVQNIDTSQEERRKLQQIFRPPNKADQEFESRNVDAQKPDPELEQYCEELNEYSDVLSGRVQIVNDRGKEVTYTDKQRKEDLKKVEALLAEYCNF